MLKLHEIPILYGTQTGNSQHLSSLLSASIMNQTFVCELDSFDISTINKYPFVIFIVSTHGDGQPPFNSSEFYKTCKNLCEVGDSDNKQAIFTFSFAILSLGDSSYSKYCKFGRDLSEVLKILGATKLVCEFSDSMDSNGMYDGFCEFLKKISSYLSFMTECASLLQQNATHIDIVHFFAKTASLLNSSKNSSTEEHHLKDKKLYGCTVLSNSEISSQNNMYELKLTCIEAAEKFVPGDCISILPSNTDNTISQHLDYLSAEEHKTILSLIDFYASPYWTFFILLTETDYVDLFHENSHLSNSQKEMYRKKIHEISCNYDLYYEYILLPKRTVLEVMEDFYLKPPYEILLNLKRITVRYFSISKIGNNTISVIYNLLSIKTTLKLARSGICTSYMRQLEEKECINIGIHGSKLFTGDNKLLFFCTGSGYTLARSFLKYYVFENVAKQIIIYYGSRYELDIVEKDVEEYNKYFSCSLATVYRATSREGNKKYIMSLFDENNQIDDIDKWIVFVSGNCRLNKEIRNLLYKRYKRTVLFQSETW